MPGLLFLVLPKVGFRARRKSPPGRLSPFAGTLPAPTFSARRCRESLQQPAGSNPASDDGWLAAKVVATGLRRVAHGRLSTLNRHNVEVTGLRRLLRRPGGPPGYLSMRTCLSVRAMKVAIKRLLPCRLGIEVLHKTVVAATLYERVQTVLNHVFWIVIGRPNAFDFLACSS